MPTRTFYRLGKERRKRMLDAAIEVFSSQTYDEVSMRSIICDMGITSGSFYRYFVSKEEFYIYIVDEMLIRFWAALDIDYMDAEDNISIEEIDRLLPSQSRFWHSFFDSSSEIRRKYYFRCEDSKLYDRLLNSVRKLPESENYPDVAVGLMAFLLNVLQYVVTSYKEISGLDFKEGDLVPLFRDIIVKGFRSYR